MALELKKVLISDSVDVSCREILESAGISVDYKPGLKKEELLDIIKDYSALIVRSATKVTEEVITAGVGLKLIGRAGTGVDNIDLNAATRNGIIVMNTPGGNTISAAEHTCSLICSTARKIPQGYASLMEGKWDRKKYMGVELEGKTLGIVGLGRIGREVATRMRSFGMKTVGYDPLVPADVAASFGVEFLELTDMWPVVDFVTVHTPLIPQTRGLMNDAVFTKCKRGVRVINVARGGIIDEDDLLTALNDGRCGGAGLDVFTQEPPQNRALVEHPNVVATPHLGASTVEAQLKVAREVAEQFVAAVKGEGLVGVVNVPRLTNALTPANTPWIKLVTNLARMITASLSAPPQEISLTLSGPAMKPLGELLTSAALVGCSSNENINLINAKSLSSTKVNLVTVGDGCNCVKVECKEKELSISGTVLGCIPTLISLNGIECGLFGLSSGNVVVVKGKSVKEAIQTLGDVKEVSVCGDFVISKVTALPSTCPEGCVFCVSL